LTEREIVKSLYNWKYGTGKAFFDHGFYPLSFGLYQKVEFDFLMLTQSDYLHEFEIKLTISDFRADNKKDLKMIMLKNGNYPANFWYVVPSNIVGFVEVPEFAGLVSAYQGEHRIVMEIKKKVTSRKLNKIDNSVLQKLLMGQMYRSFERL